MSTKELVVTNSKKYSKGVLELIQILKKNKEWKALLASSVRDACDLAYTALSKEQQKRFGILPNKKPMTWPTRKSTDEETLQKYYEFLDAYVQWIPTEKGHDEHVDEMLFQLGRFFWLIDQPDGLVLQQNVESQEAKGNAFTEWMVDFAKDWGSFLNTSASLTRDSLLSFYNDPTLNLWEYVGSVMEPEEGLSLDESRWKKSQAVWKSFNQFFARLVKPGLRPVAGMFDDRIICSGADFVLKMKAQISDDSQITVKGTHTYSIMDLLEGSPYRDRFRGGTFIHGFLSTFDYHRFMSPVRGTVLESRAIQAEVYLGVEITSERMNLSPTDETGYQFSQTRGLLIMDSPFGLVAVLPMGMAQVSSVNMTAVEGAYLNKGDEFGYFMFGGSDMIMLFEADSNVTINAAPGIHVNAGQCLGEVIKPTL